MQSHADHSQEKQTQSAANNLSVPQEGSKALFQEDNRRETIAQRKLQELMKNNSAVPIQKKENQTNTQSTVAQKTPQVIQAVWADTNNWQADANLGTATKAVIYGVDFTRNHLRAHQAAHADDMNTYAARYDGLAGANGGRNTMVWGDDIAAAFAGMNFTDRAVIIGNAGNNRFSVYVNLPNEAIAWSPLNPVNRININNLRLDVCTTYDNVELSGFVRGNRNAAGTLTALEFKVTHLNSAWD